MKKHLFLMVVFLMFMSCIDKPAHIEPTKAPMLVEEQVNDTTTVKNIVLEKTGKALIGDLKSKGFTVSYKVDEETNDTIIMQQYFMVFLKKGPIRGQPEEEIAMLEKEHIEFLDDIKALGYATIIGAFDDGDIKGMTIYNVPTLKIADSLANTDPMVKAGLFEIEIHPWWAKKGVSLH